MLAVSLSLASHIVAVSQVTVTGDIIVADTAAHVVVQTVVMAADNDVASQVAC